MARSLYLLNSTGDLMMNKKMIGLMVGLWIGFMFSHISYADDYGMKQTKESQNESQYTCDSPNGYACEAN